MSCKICQKAKDLWFHEIVMKFGDYKLNVVARAVNKAFGKGEFRNCYNLKEREVNYEWEGKCLYCGENYFIRRIV